MTEENYKYRTNPMFLRNQFGTGMPMLKKEELQADETDDLRLIGFDVAKRESDTHFNRFVHFFLYDYKFEDIWEHPDKYIERLSKYRAVLTPDFSMYIEMNVNIQRYNTFRNRWVGKYLQAQGLRVIPTVSWGLENTFDFCFNGIEKGSTVAVSTYMASAHGNRADQKDFFMAGYNEMLRQIEPEMIICYHYPFPEMQGNILFVDYDLSSWQHYDDDNIELPYTQSEKYMLGMERLPQGSNIIIKSNGFIMNEKGSGSVHGGQWQPKIGQEYLINGSPNTVVRLNINGYDIIVKYNREGKAVLIRHFTDHFYPKYHTNPHDHIITWEKPDGSPNFNHPQINYYDTVPEIKYYSVKDALMMKEDMKYSTIFEFKNSLIYGTEIIFKYQGEEYAAFNLGNEKYVLCRSRSGNGDETFESADDLMNAKFGDKKLRNIVTKLEVLHRNI